MEARTNGQLCAVVHLKSKSICADVSEISVVKSELVAEISPAEKSDSAEIQVVCEGGVCEIAWHPNRKAA